MIALNDDEARLVLDALPIPDALRHRFSAGGDGLVLSGDEADLLVDLATDRLMTRGFDASYTPTDEGAALERLIDHVVSQDDEVENPPP